MKLTVQTPAWLRRIRPPGGAHALLALPLIASPPLAADSISQVLSNTTLWIIGILAGLATLMLTLGGVRYLLANGDPAEVEKAKTALQVGRDRLRAGDPRPGHRDRAEVPGRRMRLPRAPGPARPRPGPGRRLAAVLAGAVVLAALAVSRRRGRRAPGGSRRPGPPGGSRHARPRHADGRDRPGRDGGPGPARDAGGRGDLAAGTGRLRAAGRRLRRQQRDHGLVRRAGQVRDQPAAGADRADRPVDPAARLGRGGADPVVDRARDRRRLLRAAGPGRRDHRDDPRDAADLLLGQGDRPPDRDRVRHREPVDGPHDPRGRPRQRPVRRVHRRRGEPAERRHLPDEHPEQRDRQQRDLPDPARPGRGDPGPGARGGLRDPADGRGAAGRRRPGPASPCTRCRRPPGPRPGGGGR